MDDFDKLKMIPVLKGLSDFLEKHKASFVFSFEEFPNQKPEAVFELFVDSDCIELCRAKNCLVVFSNKAVNELIEGAQSEED